MEASPEASAEKRRETIQQFSAAARNALENSEALWENLPRAPKVILSNRSVGCRESQSDPRFLLKERGR